MKRFYSIVHTIFLLSYFTLTCLAQTAEAPDPQVSVILEDGNVKLVWDSIPGSTYTLYKKEFESSEWAKLLEDYTGQEYIDTDVPLGKSYDYHLKRDRMDGWGLYTNIHAGQEVAKTKHRGRLLLLVDDTHATALQEKIERWIIDAEGDGWMVTQINVSPTMPVTEVKAIIQNEYNSPEGLESVFLLGHIPVPYSGNIKPDGHSNHHGAWAADVYYAEMNELWTDNTVTTTGQGPRTTNIPSDGKFDNSKIDYVELELGRVDFYDMPAFEETEQELLAQYLDKNHAFKNKHFTAKMQAVYDSGFSSSFFYSRDLPPVVGPENCYYADYRESLLNDSYIWSIGTGPGTYTSASGITNTTNMATDSLQGVFTTLFGSYFGDWDSQNNLLRAALGSGTILTSCWGYRPNWLYTHMALGKNIGFEYKIAPSRTTISYWPSFTNTSRYVHTALLGDPTLRMHILCPVTNLSLETNNDNLVNLNWELPSCEEELVQINIYRKLENETQFVLIDSTENTATSYIDPANNLSGLIKYMVRTEALEITPSGSFYNQSIGKQISINTTTADQDGDGFTLEEDCNDNNADISQCCNNTDNFCAEAVVLSASDGGPYDQYGWDVAIDDNRAVVGAIYSGTSSVGPGSVYVYDLIETDWVETKLVASDGHDSNLFGGAVDVEGDRIVVGAHDALNGEEEWGLGAVYVYDLVDGLWQETKIIQSNDNPQILFGWSVSVSGDRLVVGVDGADSYMYVFNLEGGIWEESHIYSSDNSAIGSTAILENNRIVTIGYDDDFNSKIYVYDYMDGVWIETILPYTFYSVVNISFSGNRIVATGNYIGDDVSSIYVYDLIGDVWSETLLQESDSIADNYFGHSVAVNENRVVARATHVYEESFNAGSAFVYDLNNNVWDANEISAAQYTPYPGFFFGWSISLSKDRIIVGGQDERVYLFEGCCKNANTFKAKVLLEGAYISSSIEMNTDLLEAGIFPNTPPYNQPPWNLQSAAQKSDTITNITDWILVEVLDHAFMSVEVQAALLDKKGNLRNPNGSFALDFYNLDSNESYYFIIRHRNHIDVMSSEALALNNAIAYDFTSPTNIMGGDSQLNYLGNEYYGMISGDFNGNGIINVTDFNEYANYTGAINQYLQADNNLDGNVSIADFNLYQLNASKIGIQQIRY